MIITDRNEIDKLVEKFREILRDKLSQTYQIYAGYPGGNELITAYWSGELGYWSGFLNLEGKS